MNLSPEEKPYLRAVEEFLQQLDGHETDAVCMIALDPEAGHLLCTWRCPPWILAQLAGILQLSATQQMLEDYEEDDEDEAEQTEDN